MSTFLFIINPPEEVPGWQKNHPGESGQIVFGGEGIYDDLKQRINPPKRNAS